MHRFRLALADFEALRRAGEYLADLDIDREEFLFAAASGSTREIRAIRDQTRGGFERISEAISWPRGVPELWCRGFLAGIFDAEGCYSRGILRIANCDPVIIDWTAWSLRTLGFDFAIEPSGRPNGLANVRLRGGLREAIRFFHICDPAITRKRSIEGVALKSDAKLGVASIEPLGKRQLFDITTGTGDFIANGVVSHNCFARNTHTYLDLNAGRDFEREIVVKVNVPELLRAELSRPSWKRELVAFGTNTDPYQWAEGKYELMPPMLEALRDAETPTSILTKSPLVAARPRSLLELAEVADVERQLLGADARREDLARDRAAHAAPAQAAGGGGEVQRGGDPVRRAGRAADAGHQRLARAGRRDRLARRGGGGDLRQRHRASSAARG